jgi:hypothetical protein
MFVRHSESHDVGILKAFFIAPSGKRELRCQLISQNLRRSKCRLGLLIASHAIGKEGQGFHKERRHAMRIGLNRSALS